VNRVNSENIVNIVFIKGEMAGQTKKQNKKSTLFLKSAQTTLHKNVKKTLDINGKSTSEQETH
jgi:hypothetical protein